MIPALRIKNITKKFGTLLANENISLTLKQGEMLALLGENGAGKTTLMNILFGHYVATEGSIEVFAKPLREGSPKAALAAGIGMVHQHFTLAGNMTVLENIMLGTESLFSISQSLGKAREKLIKLSMQFSLHTDWQSKVRDLSIGEQQRVEILKALFRDAKILVLDEPTAVLTPQESEKLFRTLRLLTEQGLSVIFITHKLREAIAASDRCVVLRHGRIVHQSKTEETSIGKLAEAMVGGSIPGKKKVASAGSTGKPLLQCSDITIAGSGGRAVFQNLNLEIHSGEIVGLAGVSGNGQTELANLLSGMLPPDKGTITLDGIDITNKNPAGMVAAGIGRIPEDRTGTGIIGDMTVAENIAIEAYRSPEYTRAGMMRFQQCRKRAENLIKTFDIRCPSFETKVRKLSGGNIQKLILARVLAAAPKLIIAGQPTWGLDVGAASFVHDQLLRAREEGAGVLLISEDLDEILQLADRIQVIYKGKLSQAISADKAQRSSIGLAMSGQLENISVEQAVVS